MNAEVESIIVQGLLLLDKMQNLNSDNNFADVANLSFELAELCHKLQSFPQSELKDHEADIRQLLDKLMENTTETSELQSKLKDEMFNMRKKNIGARAYLRNTLVKYL